MKKSFYLSLLMVCISGIAFSCGKSEERIPEDSEKLCSDKIDNDDNGLMDCQEETCQDFDFCTPEEDTEKECTDGVDNDCYRPCILVDKGADKCLPKPLIDFDYYIGCDKEKITNNEMQEVCLVNPCTDKTNSSCYKQCDEAKLNDSKMEKICVTDEKCYDTCDDHKIETGLMNEICVDNNSGCTDINDSKCHVDCDNDMIDNNRMTKVCLDANKSCADVLDCIVECGNNSKTLCSYTDNKANPQCYVKCDDSKLNNETMEQVCSPILCDDKEDESCYVKCNDAKVEKGIMERFSADYFVPELCADKLDVVVTSIDDVLSPEEAPECYVFNKKVKNNQCYISKPGFCNGASDCDEDSCLAYCREDSNEKCSDGLDNDRSGVADCADSKCKCEDVGLGEKCKVTVCKDENIVPETTKDLCIDGLDNDNNGVFDCADPNCSKLPVCSHIEDSEAYCSDNIDNDSNGVKDCEDPNCANFVACFKPECNESELMCYNPKTVKWCNNGRYEEKLCEYGCNAGECTKCDSNAEPICRNGYIEKCHEGNYIEKTWCEFGCNDKGTECRICEEDAYSCAVNKTTFFVCKENQLIEVEDNCGGKGCDNTLCIDRNGNHWLDEYEIYILDKAEKCTSTSDCTAGSQFYCDSFIGRCANKCATHTGSDITENECINDDYSCRNDGRCAPAVFETVWNPGYNRTITIPTVGTSCKFKIDWGDGNGIESKVNEKGETVEIEYTCGAKLEHTYGTGIENVHVKIYADSSFTWQMIPTTLVPGMDSYTENAKKLIEVVSFGPVVIGENAFKDAENLKSVSSIDIPDSSTLKTMKNMFSGCKSLVSGLEKWDVSNVTDMSEAFVSCSSFNEDIGRWDTSKVTTMSSMFKDATAFNTDIGRWDTSKVTNMSSMFEGASAFNQSISRWSTSDVTDMSSMFKNAGKFNQELNGLDVSKVTNFSQMFSHAEAFDMPLLGWVTTAALDMSSMFEGATAFNQYIGSWDVSKVTNMNSMFKEASSFNQNIGAWTTSSVTDMSSMFYNAASFNQKLDDWNTSSVQNMSMMFLGAKAFFSNIKKWDVSKVTDFSMMFDGASAFELSLVDWVTSSVKECSSFSNMFLGTAIDCVSAKAMLEAWNSSVCEVSETGCYQETDK